MMTTRRNSIKVLVVDESMDNADSLLLLVESYGYAARAVYTARGGLAIAYECRPSVIFLDIAMPGMSGIDAVGLLRADEQFRNTMIVALSAYVGQALVGDRLQRFDRLVTKRIAAEELGEILEIARGWPVAES